MRDKYILFVMLLASLFFLSGCFNSSYDYTSGFEDVGENSVTGSEQDSSLSNRSLNGQFAFSLKLVPVKVEVIAIDENLKEKKTIAGKIAEDGYSFSVDKFSYPTSLIKIRYTLKNLNRDFKMNFSQYASIADNHNLSITLASAIKGSRIESLIDDDAFSFDAADLKATRELYHILRLDSATAGLKSSDSLSHWLAVNTMNSYVENMSYSYFGGNFDSTFQKRFELLSSALSDENLWWNSVSKIEIADAIVRNFRDRIIPMDGFLKPFADFWSGAYKLPACDSSNFLDSIKNPAKSSVYFENAFICNKGGSKNVFYYWHPVNEMEDEIGLCPLLYQCSKMYNDSVYVSNRNDMDWRLGNAKETLIYLYGECNNSNYKKVRVACDTIFLCDRDYKGFFWSLNIDSLSVSRETFREYLVLKKYGECSKTNNLVKGIVDSTYFVQCVDEKWIEISEDVYFGDSCTEARTGERLRTPRAKYYRCVARGDKYAWIGILAPEYFGDVCDDARNKRIVEHDSVYFKCNSGLSWGTPSWGVLKTEDILPPVFHKDTCRENRVVKYGDVYYICRDKEWKALSKEEIIPPVLDELPCGKSEKQSYVNYDDDYFICDNDKWSLADKDTIPLPIIHGDTCDSRYWEHMVEYDNEYFICSWVYATLVGGYWYKAEKSSAAVYKYNKNRGSYCASGQEGTSLEWNSEIDALMGCVRNTRTNDYEWGIVRLGDSTSLNEKEFAGGKFKANGVYEVTVDGIAYDFSGFQLSRVADTWKYGLVAYMYNHHVTIGNIRYEAAWADTNLYINSVRGETVVDLSDIEPKSDSYKEFYEMWTDWVEQGNTCNGNAYGFHFPITSIQLKQYGEGFFADWNTAKTFCPKGFHIPDTTEWRKSSINTRTNAIASVVETYEPDHGRCNDKYSKGLVLLWSSTEKDPDTQFCLGYTTTQSRGDNRKGFLECPKDLFPLGQVMCVKDK